jgi:hypothetical protein
MSDKLIAIEYDGLTKEVIERELTSEEVAQKNEDYLAFESELQAKSDARTSALGKLVALGLTEEEIAAL